MCISLDRLAPLRVEAFCSLVVAGNISMADTLRRKWLMSESISDMYGLCGRDLESIDHLFIHCDVTPFIWGYSLKEYGVNWCSSSSLGVVYEV